MEHRNFKALTPTKSVYTYTLADGRETLFKMPAAIMMAPVHDALSAVPDEGTCPPSVRRTILLEVAGSIIGLTWADPHFRLSADWRRLTSWEAFGNEVVDELMTGCQGVDEVTNKKGKVTKQGKPGYEPWGMEDLLGCLSGIAKQMHTRLPKDSEVSEAANFTSTLTKEETNTH